MLTCFILLCLGGEDPNIAEFTMIQDLSFTVNIAYCFEPGGPVNLGHLLAIGTYSTDFRGAIKLLSSGTPGQHLRTLWFICYIEMGTSFKVEHDVEGHFGELDEFLTALHLPKNITISFEIRGVRSNFWYRNVADAFQRALPCLHSVNHVNITAGAPSR